MLALGVPVYHMLIYFTSFLVPILASILPQKFDASSWIIVKNMSNNGHKLGAIFFGNHLHGNGKCPADFPF